MNFSSLQRKIFLITILFLFLIPSFVFVKIKKTSAQICAATLDIVFAIDSTGSMGPVIAKAKAQAIAIMVGIEDALADFSPDIQYGVIDFRDYADGGAWPYIIRQTLTKDKTAVRNAINLISAGGGGDLPEAYTRVMYESYHSSAAIGYRDEAFRILLMIGDDVPHDKTTTATPPSGASFDAAYDGPPYTDPVAGPTNTVLTNMASNGFTLIYLDASRGGNQYVDDWAAWAAVTGGSSHAINGVASLVDVIVEAVVKAFFDRDGDGYMTLICPCNPAELPPGIIGCWDCNDTRFDATAAEAWECFTGGLVPCGRKVDDFTTAIDETAPCTLCHFFVLIKRIVDFLLGSILFPILVLLMIIGGTLLLTAGGSESRIRQGKDIIRTAIIATIIALCAWLIIDTVIVFLTPATSPLQSWHTITCPVP